jgi:hypothetical protein
MQPRTEMLYVMLCAFQMRHVLWYVFLNGWKQFQEYFFCLLVYRLLFFQSKSMSLWVAIAVSESRHCMLVFTLLTYQRICAKYANLSRSQWPRGLRHVCARLLGLWVRIPPGTWMSVVSVFCCQVEVSATG